MKLAELSKILEQKKIQTDEYYESHGMIKERFLEESCREYAQFKEGNFAQEQSDFGTVIICELRNGYTGTGKRLEWLNESFTQRTPR